MEELLVGLGKMIVTESPASNSKDVTSIVPQPHREVVHYDVPQDTSYLGTTCYHLDWEPDFNIHAFCGHLKRFGASGNHKEGTGRTANGYDVLLSKFTHSAADGKDVEGILKVLCAFLILFEIIYTIW